MSRRNSTDVNADLPRKYSKSSLQKLNKDAFIDSILRDKSSDVVTKDFLVSILDEKFFSLSTELDKRTVLLYMLQWRDL